MAIGQTSKSCTYTPFLLQRVEIELILLYGQQFLRYGPFFKIAIFGHETWPLAKVPKLAHMLPILSPSPKFHSILLYGWPYLRYWQFFIFLLATATGYLNLLWDNKDNFIFGS